MAQVPDSVLLEAIDRGDIREVENLLRPGHRVAINARDTDGLTALHYACKKGHTAIVQHLVRAGADEYSEDNDGWTPLHWASFSGSYDVVRHLCDTYISVNLLDNKDRTPLHLAATTGHVEVACYLLRGGAAVDAKDDSGLTPLICTGLSGYGIIANWLLKYGANVNAKSSNGRTALHCAARKGHQAVVETLLRGRANIHSVDAKGKTALMWAAAGGYTPIVELLLAWGANIAAKNCEGNTALHWAADRGYDEVVEVLLKSGAEVDSRNICQRTALSWAAEKGRDHTARLLLQRGADVGSRDSNGFQPLHWASYMGKDGAVTILLNGGADIEARDIRECTALHWAAGTGRTSTVQLLLKYRANPDTTDSLGRTPLHRAVQMGKDGPIPVLLNAGADLEARDGKGRTALHWAATHGHVLTAKLLLENHANIHSTNNNGLTPAQVATGADVTFLLTSWAITASSLPPASRLRSKHAGHPPALDPARSVLKARKWIHEAQNHIRSGTKTSAKSRRIKVAVIDTGVDMENHDISPHERRIKFLRGAAEDNKDYDGHGTLVVQLLLGLARDIDVYVHKVAESRESLDLSESQINDLAKVITDAARKPSSGPNESGHTSEKREAESIGIDILNLSFGFPDPDDPKLEPLRSALHQIHTINNVLVLAASRNDGGNASVMWPASERSCVICVNSSDADGNPSSFNPTQPMPKFCTLGEGLELRLTKDQMATAAKKMKDATQVARDRVESGTSFAAPIATAIVATILGFVDGNVEGAELNERQKHRLKKLRTQHGMLQVLKERCVESSLATRNDYYYIAPWFFSLDPANIHGILDALGRA